MLYDTALCPEFSGPPFVPLKCSNFAYDIPISATSPRLTGAPTTGDASSLKEKKMMLITIFFHQFMAAR